MRRLRFGGRRRLRRLASYVLPRGEFTLPKDLADRTGAVAKSRSLSWRLGMLTLVVVLPLSVSR